MRYKLKDDSGNCLTRFTLVELLVVMAIIAILMSSLLPVLHKARDSARASVCRNNLKNVASSLFTYSTENCGNSIPCIFRVNVSGVNRYYSWIDYMYNNETGFTKDVFKCPSMNDDECYDPYGGQSVPLPKFVLFSSYTMNVIEEDAWTCASIGSDPDRTCGWGTDSYTPINIMRVADASNKIFITDVLKKRPEYTFTDSDATRIVHFLETDHGAKPLGTGTERRDVGDHHSGGFNALMGDMHVESILHSLDEQWAVFVQ